MEIRLRCKLLPLALVLLVSACSSNNIYRSNYASCTYQQPGDCSTNALQVHSDDDGAGYTLGFVEYDDQGQLRDPAQQDAVLDKYLNIAAGEDVLLISFIHGWHHDARPGDDNIESFRGLLTEVSAMETRASQQQQRQKRRILGVYVGWRGESVEVPGLRYATFWDRKSTAHTVGQQGVSEMLLKLEQIVNVRAGFEQDNPPPVNSRLVVVGHSFGGAVLYGSLQKILVDRFIGSRRGETSQGDVQGFGDLVVLMNPAFEALRYSTLYDMSQAHCRAYFSTQLPKLAILTSETDYATRYAFPIGRFLNGLSESYTTLDRHYCSQAGSAGMQPMQIGEASAGRTTVGHFEPYLTHRLVPAPQQALRAENFNVRQLQTRWSRQEELGMPGFEGSELIHLQRSTALNPYLNIQVDSELIPDHNHIWGKEVVAFLRDLIAISTTPMQSASSE